MGVRENKIEKYLNDEVKRLGGITRKWVSPQRIGVPDRIVIIRGMVYFVEVKTVDGTVTDAQKREQTALTDHGANVVTVYGHNGVDSLIDLLRIRIFP